MSSVKWVCAKEAAEMMGLSQATLSRWRKRKIGPQCLKDARGQFAYNKMQIDEWKAQPFAWGVETPEDQLKIDALKWATVANARNENKRPPVRPGYKGRINPQCEWEEMSPEEQDEWSEGSICRVDRYGDEIWKPLGSPAVPDHARRPQAQEYDDKYSIKRKDVVVGTTRKAGKVKKDPFDITHLKKD